MTVQNKDKKYCLLYEYLFFNHKYHLKNFFLKTLHLILRRKSIGFGQ